MDLLAGRRPSNINGKRSDGGGGMASKNSKVGASGGVARVRVRYNTHLPALSVRERDKSQTLLASTVSPTRYIHVICKIWHLCGGCWEDCKRKTHMSLHPPPPVGGDCNCQAAKKIPVGLT